MDVYSKLFMFLFADTIIMHVKVFYYVAIFGNYVNS